MKQKEPKYVAQTLAWCNLQRKNKGKRALKKLPKGYKGDGFTCPCGKAIGIWVGYDTHGASPMRVSNPKYLSAFVCAFDRGLLPQYEKKYRRD
jgi:hypothetical protein